MKIKKTKIDSHKELELGMIVFHDALYDGKEPMRVVGIRELKVELEGDYSGGTHPVTQSDWLPIKGTFRIRKECDNRACKAGLLHNLQCNYPTCEPYLNTYPIDITK